MSAEIKDLLSDLIKGLVNKPDEVEVSENEGDKVLIFEARVAKEDMGKVIGKKGKTIEAIKTIVGACGAKQKKRFIFQIVDEEDN
ncbi:MAG: KH domain-containing protein [Bdellovibrionales bacterium]